MIIFISSAFFWLISLFFSGCLWRIITVNTDSNSVKRYQLALGVVFAVVFQELFRFLFYKLLKRAEKGLMFITGESSKLARHKLAYVSGFGYGAISGAFAFGNVLADSTGPGIVSNIDYYGEQFNAQEEFFLVSAFLTLCFIFLNTTWGIIWFAGYNSSNWLHLSVAAASHLFASLITLLNYDKGSAARALVPNYVLLMGLTAYAYKAAGGKFSNLSLLFK